MIRWNMKNNITFKKERVIFLYMFIYLFSVLVLFYLETKKKLYIFYLKNKLFLNEIKNSYIENHVYF